MKMKPSRRDIAKLLLHRMKSAIRYNTLYVLRKCMSRSKYNRCCSHRLPIKVYREMLMVLFFYQLYPFKYVVLLSGAEGYIPSFAFPAAPLIYEQ